MSILKSIKDDSTKKEAIYALVRQSRTDMGYYFMLGTATLITTIGLTLNNGAVVIGGMLIAPILTPMLALGLGFVTLSMNSLQRSLLGIFNSVAAVLLLSFLFSLISHDNDYLTPEILLRGEFDILYLYIAFLSGLGAAYSMLDPRVSSSLPGVAVSVSLLPPLCVSGIAIAQVNKILIVYSLQLFLANFLGIVIASVLVFAFFRFYKFRHIEEREITKEINEEDK